MPAFDGQPLSMPKRKKEIERLRNSIEYHLATNYHYGSIKVARDKIAEDITILEYLVKSL